MSYRRAREGLLSAAAQSVKARLKARLRLIADRKVTAVDRVDARLAAAASAAGVVMKLELRVVEASGAGGAGRGALGRRMARPHVHLGVHIGVLTRVQVHVAGQRRHLRAAARGRNEAGHSARRDVHVVPPLPDTTDATAAAAAASVSAAAVVVVGGAGRRSHRHRHRWRRGQRRTRTAGRGGTAAAVTRALTDGAQRLTRHVLGAEARLRGEHLGGVAGVGGRVVRAAGHGGLAALQAAMPVAAGERHVARGSDVVIA